MEQPPRPLTLREQSVLGVVRNAVSDLVAEERARLEIVWPHWAPGRFAVFKLTPAADQACPLQIWAYAPTWIDFSFGPEGTGTSFELWAERRDERIALLRDCLRPSLTAASKSCCAAVPIRHSS